MLDGKTVENWQFKLDPAAKRFVALATIGPNGTHEDFSTTTGNKDRDGTWSGRIKGIHEIDQGSPRVAFDPVFRQHPNSFDVDPASHFITPAPLVYARYRE